VNTRIIFVLLACLALLTGGLLICPPGLAPRPLVAAQFATDPDAVTLKPNWKKGQSHRYTIIMEVQGEKELTFRKASTTPVDIVIEKADADGYEISWTTGQPQFPDSQARGMESDSRLRELLKEYRMVLKVNPQGVLAGLADWEQARQDVLASLKAGMELSRQARGQGPIPEKLWEGVQEMFGTREAIEAICLRYPSPLFSLMGGTYRRNRPVESDGEVPSVFGGPAIPAKVKVTLESVDRRSQVAELVMVQTCDTQKLMESMAAAVERVAQRAGKKMADTLPSVKVELEDTIEYAFDLDQAWPITMIHTRRLVSPAGARLERTTFKPRASPKP